MTENMQRPGVGTAVWVRKEGKVLLGMRTSDVAHGTWGAPGGRVEMFEEPMAAAVREVSEEAGIEVKNTRFVGITNDISEELGTHYITLHYSADWASGEPRDEKGGMENWQWIDWNKPPEPLFWSARNFIKNGYNPFTI